MRYFIALVIALAMPLEVMAYGLTYVGKVKVNATFDLSNNTYTGVASGSVSVTQNPSARPESYIGFSMGSALYHSTELAIDTHPIISFIAVDSTTGAKFSCGFVWGAVSTVGLILPTPYEIESSKAAWNRAHDAMLALNQLSYLTVRATRGSCTSILHEKNSYMQTTPAGGITTNY